MYKKISLVALIIILMVVNWSIYKKEMHLKNGKIVYLKIAPVDPRSLMQGDYMALRFELANKIYAKLREEDKFNTIPRSSNGQDGLVVVSLDDKKVASLVSLSKNHPLKKNELLLQYRVRKRVVKFATNAFFFQEGTASKYEKAKYGEFRVNEKGELLLIAMADENVTLIR